MARCRLILPPHSAIAECMWCKTQTSYQSLVRHDPRPQTAACPAQPSSLDEAHVWCVDDGVAQIRCLVCGTSVPTSVGAVVMLPHIPCVPWVAPTPAPPPKATGTTAGMFTIEGLDECQVEVDHRTYSGTCKRCRQVYSFEHLTRFGKPICPGELPKPGSQKTCAQCGGDWSAYLDAYYGVKHEDAVRCAKCRKG